MGLTNTPVRNPLTLIAIFAALAETTAVAVLPALEKDIQSIFVWFVMLFPVTLLVLFFVTLWFKPVVLYGPGDFDDEQNFVDLNKKSSEIQTEVAVNGAVVDYSRILRTYWQPDGKINRSNERRLKEKIMEHCSNELSIPFFLLAKEYGQTRKKVAEELNLA